MKKVPGKWNHLGIYMVMAFTLLTGVLCPKMITFAGGINGNEASVISAASGTFTYEGKTYRAGTSYINSLISYLSSDDVDLTAEQASEAISTMYSSVAEGVSRGYLYEVTDDTTQEASTEESEADWADAENEDTDKTEQQKTENQSQNETAKDSSRVDVWDAMSNPTENKQKLKERPDKKEASASVELQEEGIVVTTRDKEKISISKNRPIISNRVVLVISVISGILFGITLVCGIILFSTKCMSFKRHKGRKARPGHSKRRKIRHYTRAVMTITTAVSLVGILILIGLYVSLFNNDAIMQNMQSSGYFRYAYSEYISKQAEDMMSDLQTAIKEGEDQKLQTYDEYLFTIKQNSLKVLGGNLEIIIPDSNVTPYIYNLKVSCTDIFCKAGIFMLGSVLFGMLLMVFMDQRRERGVKHIAVSVLSASCVMALATLVMLVCKPYTMLYIEPDYLYLFLMECIKRCVTALTSITAFGIVLGMLCIGIYRTMSNSRS